MPVNLSGRHFLKLLDFTSDEVRYLIDLSSQFKALKLTGTPHRYLEDLHAYSLRIRGCRYGPWYGRHLPGSG